MIPNIQFIPIAYDSPDYWKVVRLREQVLRLPLNMRFLMTDLELESTEKIWAYKTENNQIIASNQFILSNSTAKLRQVVTDPRYQRQGYGARLFLESEAALQALGIQEIYCHARDTAVDFYLKLGFEIDSEEFLEVGIRHYKMRKGI